MILKTINNAKIYEDKHGIVKEMLEVLKVYKTNKD